MSSVNRNKDQSTGRIRVSNEQSLTDMLVDELVKKRDSLVQQLDDVQRKIAVLTGNY